MRNIFDHYSQNENQLTHALFSVLQNDRNLLASFVEEICGVQNSKAETLSVSVQRYPFARSYDDTEIVNHNIPDAWIFDEDGFALVFEAKISSSLTQEQLYGHQKVAAKFGFERARYFTIAASENAGEFENWNLLTWKAIYIWLRENEAQSVWAKHSADYFEILEARMMENGQLGEGDLTSFTGFPDDENGYSYLVAKATLQKAMADLRKDERLIDILGMNPDSPGRGAITGRQSDIVWDYLTIDDHAEKTGFTSFLHLTLGIGSEGVEAMITVPNQIKTTPRNKIKALGVDGFRAICEEIVVNAENLLVDVPYAMPIIRGIQRRYPFQRSEPYVDALIEADLRTAFDGDGKPKYQPEWIEAVYRAFLNRKSSSNFQFQVGFYYEYRTCNEIYRADALNLITQSWLACEPLVSLCREK